MISVPIRIIRRESRSGKSIQVITDSGKFLWIPKWALLDDFLPGERDIVLDCKYGLWAEDLVAEEYREMMAQEGRR